MLVFLLYIIYLGIKMLPMLRVALHRLEAVKTVEDFALICPVQPILGRTAHLAEQHTLLLKENGAGHPHHKEQSRANRARGRPSLGTDSALEMSLMIKEPPGALVLDQMGSQTV